MFGQNYDFIFNLTEERLNTFAQSILIHKKMKLLNNKTLIIIGAIMLFLLAAFHITFWSLFDWKNDLIKLSQDNQGIVQMMNVCTICYLFSMSGILFICCTDITKSRVGKLLLLSLSLFFAVRLVLEFIFPDGSLSLAFILLLLVVIFTIPALPQNTISE